MGWLICALGAILALCGAASIVAGIPYVRLEFGWTEIIAGSTALSAGVVTLSLGAVLFALKDIRRGLVPPGVTDGSALAIRTVLPFPDAEAQVDDALAQPSDNATEALPEVAVSPPVARPRMERFKSRLGTMGMPKAEADADLRSREPVLSAAPTAEDALPAEPMRYPADAFAGSRPSIDPPSWRADRLGDLDRDVEPSGSPAPERGSSLAALEPDRQPTLHPSSEAPTVVGRYESGGASYVLFSDGTIEVETETGTHRFGSMQELKQHIELQTPA